MRANKFKGNDAAAIRLEGDLNYVVLNQAKDGDSFQNDGGTTGNEGRGNTTSGANAFP